MRNSTNPASQSSTSATETAAAICARFGLRACWYEPFPFDAQLPRIEPGRVVLPAIEPGIEPWRLGDIELPVRYGDLLLGRFVLRPVAPTCGIALDPSTRDELVRIAATIAPAIAAHLRAAR
jgi:hypothetical protein